MNVSSIPAFLERVMGYVDDDPHARLTEDILDDINRIRVANGEPMLDYLPAYVYCPGCRVLRIVE